MNIDPVILQILKQLLLAVVLGGLIGFERWYNKKPAGLRTYSLVALGACIFTIISTTGFNADIRGFDPSRVVSQIVVGIGFLGVGIIFQKENIVQGLTTAAGLWVTAAIGTAVGLHLYTLAVLATTLALAIFWIFYSLEQTIPRGDRSS